MEYTLFKKTFAFIIIIIFLGVSVSPPINSSIVNDKIMLLEKQNPHCNLSDFDQNITLFMKRAHFPSLSACIIKNNSIVWSEGYGLCDINNDVEASNHTIYMAGSISKTVTATALMQLYERGCFDLDDDVNDYLPFNLRNPKYPNVNITFRMLLSHQSSLSNKKLNLFFYFSLLNYPNGWLKEYLVPGGCIYNKKIWNDEPPGEASCYSDEGFEILSYLIELISGQPFTEYCNEHIFEPLNMTNTSFCLSDLDAKKIAHPYIWILRRYMPIPKYQNGNAASGGLQTSVLDLSNFLIAHMNDGMYDNVSILEEETVTLMHSIQYPESNLDKNRRYGLGWCIWTNENNEALCEGHTGAIPGFVSFMFHKSSDDTAIIFFANQYRGIAYPLEAFYWSEIQKELFKKASSL